MEVMCNYVAFMETEESKRTYNAGQQEHKAEGVSLRYVEASKRD